MAGRKKRTRKASTAKSSAAGTGVESSSYSKAAESRTKKKIMIAQTNRVGTIFMWSLFATLMLATVAGFLFYGYKTRGKFACLRKRG